MSEPLTATDKDLWVETYYSLYYLHCMVKCDFDAGTPVFTDHLNR